MRLRRDWEKPPHKVRISPFYLGAYEVTQAQYRALTKNTPSYFSATGGGRDLVASLSTDDYPVENVSWLDAVGFCNALSKRDGFPRYYQLSGDKLESVNAKVRAIGCRPRRNGSTPVAGERIGGTVSEMTCGD